jgi:hypothetical protein
MDVCTLVFHFEMAVKVPLISVSGMALLEYDGMMSLVPYSHEWHKRYVNAGYVKGTSGGPFRHGSLDNWRRMITLEPTDLRVQLQEENEQSKSCG